MMKLDDYLKEQNAKEEACCCAPTKVEPSIGMTCLDILNRLKDIDNSADSIIYLITGKDDKKPKLDDPGNIRAMLVQLDIITGELYSKVNRLRELIC